MTRWRCNLGAFTGVAIVGGVLGALLSHPDRALASAAFNLLIGVPLLVLGLRARRIERTKFDPKMGWGLSVGYDPYREEARGLLRIGSSFAAVALSLVITALLRDRLGLGPAIAVAVVSVLAIELSRYWSSGVPERLAQVARVGQT